MGLPFFNQHAFLFQTYWKQHFKSLFVMWGSLIALHYFRISSFIVVCLPGWFVNRNCGRHDGNPPWNTSPAAALTRTNLIPTL